MYGSVFVYYINMRTNARRNVKMRARFTTTLNEQLLEALKIQAVKEKTSVNKILERLIEQYLKTLGDSSPT